jgi:protein-S-isoprenylcysteine O-methyltransferase Ste14
MYNKAMRSFLFERGFILPVTVTGLVPLVLIAVTRAWLGLAPLSAPTGAVLYLVGLSMLVSTTRLFARHRGSLAPWNPPKEMVVIGPYRHCRNPMISGVYAMLLGEALAFASPWLAAWALTFIVGMSSHIFLQEEPRIRERFGDAYLRYCQAVPRWLPRLRPYQP